MKTNSKWLRGAVVLVGILLWLSVIAKGFSVLEREEFTPVAKAAVVADFPAHSAIPLATDRATLLVFFHPQCPCSRATLRELDRILARTQNRMGAVVVFTIPKGEPSDWEKTDLWKTAQAMPGVVVLRDRDGVEAGRFGVKGSGHALLFDNSGKLLFSGGITSSRGHEGDNLGSEAIVSFVLRGNALVSRTPVFGCSLL